MSRRVGGTGGECSSFGSNQAVQSGGVTKLVKGPLSLPWADHRPVSPSTQRVCVCMCISLCVSRVRVFSLSKCVSVCPCVCVCVCVCFCVRERKSTPRNSSHT